MHDIATATLSGSLTREVELSELPSGSDVARLRVASTTRRRNGEERDDRTSYPTVEVYNAPAALRAEYLRKGSRVIVHAELDWLRVDRPAEQPAGGCHPTLKARQCCSRARAPARTTMIRSASATVRAPSPRAGRGDRPGGRIGQRRQLAVLKDRVEPSSRPTIALGREARRHPFASDRLFLRLQSIQHVR